MTETLPQTTSQGPQKSADLVPSNPTMTAVMIAPLSRDELSLLEVQAKYNAESPFAKKLGGIGGIMAVMLYGRELGIGPNMSVQKGFHNVEGHLEMSAYMMNLRLRQFGHRVEVVKADDESAVLTVTRGDTGEKQTLEYTIGQAAKAGLVRPNSNWERRPGEQLYWACLRILTRRLVPEALGPSLGPGEAAELFPEDVGRPAIMIPPSPGRGRKKKTILAPEEQPPVTVEAKVVEPDQPVEAEADTETDECEPDPEVGNHLNIVQAYLKDTHHIEDKGIEYAERLICDHFGVHRADMVPADRLSELKSFTKNTLLQELERECWIPSRRQQ